MALALTAKQMQCADRWAIDTLGVPGLVLMENAGRGVVRLILRTLASRGQPIRGTRVCVVCGAGQNGGDGFVIARHLSLSGARVKVLLAMARSKISGDAAVNAAALDAMQAVEFVDASGDQDVPTWQRHLHGASVVVDAIFGTGLRSDVQGVPAAAIQAINDSAALRVAVDVPSGLDADTGLVRGVAVRADFTGTMGAYKLGLFLNADAPVGQVEIMRLGVPLHTPDEGGPYAHLIGESHVRALLPQPATTAHKGSRGHVLLIAGSPGKTGAAVLAATSALRAGAGLCTVMSTRAGQQALDAKVIEVMTGSYADGDDADGGSFDRIVAALAGKRAVALGPGIPLGPGMRTLVADLGARLAIPLVIDADGLNHLGTDAAAILKQAPAPRILTPHPGEAGRLLGIEAAEVEADRLGVVRRLAERTGAVTVLKGARTLIALPSGQVHINPVADPALATAGSGDVLTGVIVALLGQGLLPEDAAVVGVYAHGQAAAVAKRATGTRNLLAGDLPLAVARWLAPDDATDS